MLAIIAKSQAGAQSESPFSVKLCYNGTRTMETFVERAWHERHLKRRGLVFIRNGLQYKNACILALSKISFYTFLTGNVICFDAFEVPLETVVFF